MEYNSFTITFPAKENPVQVHGVFKLTNQPIMKDLNILSHNNR